MPIRIQENVSETQSLVGNIKCLATPEVQSVVKITKQAKHFDILK